jgi:TPP-dependent pyruvate/acetoin dehydrogenase alpha subunit
MKRFQAYDPPEYLNWQPEPHLLDEYRATIEKDETKRKIVQDLNSAKLLALYAGLLRNRLHDIALKRWVKQGVISKAWLGTGEEATTIGPVHALNHEWSADGLSTDFVAPMIRNAGACHEMDMSLADMLRGYLGTDDSPTHGRDLHIGDFKRGVISPISHVGDIMAVAAGVALSFKINKQRRLAMTWIGDGSTKSGVFHEAMNFAAVQHLPFIVIIQNNQVALGTRLDQHHRSSFVEWHEAYGIGGAVFDGNNVLDAYATAKIAVDKCRRGEGPFLLVSETFRMGGHATHDEREARATFAAELFDFWGKRDPIGLFEAYLIEDSRDLETNENLENNDGLREKNRAILQQIENQVTQEIEQAQAEALRSAKSNMPVPASAAEGVYSKETKKGNYSVVASE